MTAPLTHAACDLQDFPFMPLHVARLRDSDLAAEEDPEACWYAVMLWAAAWHQIPAASLPDNDAVLARLCGLGRDVKTFRKHKAGALRGFILCDDGRLYHPVVAEQAREAWQSKLQQRWRTECARIKKANQRNGTEHPSPDFDAWLSSYCPDDVPGDKAETGKQCPSGKGIQETGTGTGNIIPFSNEKGRDASDEEFWDSAKGYLGASKGSMIGKWVKEHGKLEVARAIAEAQVERPADKIAYISGILRKRANDGYGPGHSGIPL